jgi:hypothetical protein
MNRICLVIVEFGKPKSFQIPILIHDFLVLFASTSYVDTSCMYGGALRF